MGPLLFRSNVMDAWVNVCGWDPCSTESLYTENNGVSLFSTFKKKILFCISDILILSSLVENLKLQKLQKVKASRFWRNKVISVGPGEDPEQ